MCVCVCVCVSIKHQIMDGRTAGLMHVRAARYTTRETNRQIDRRIDRDD